MGEPAKFLFDRTFEQPLCAAEQEANAIEQRLRAAFDQELAAARAERDRAAMESLEARIAETLEAVLARTVAMTEDTARARHDINQRAVRTALAAAEALAPELIRRQPLAGLETMLGECLEYASDAPHIAVRVNDGLVEDVLERVKSLAKVRGFAGEIMVLGDPEIPPGDTRLEWADGGLGRDFEVTRSHVAETVQRYLEAQEAEMARRGDVSESMAAAQLDADRDPDRKDATLATEIGETR